MPGSPQIVPVHCTSVHNVHSDTALEEGTMPGVYMVCTLYATLYGSQCANCSLCTLNSMHNTWCMVPTAHVHTAHIHTAYVHTAHVYAVYLQTAYVHTENVHTPHKHTAYVHPAHVHTEHKHTAHQLVYLPG